MGEGHWEVSRVRALKAQVNRFQRSVNLTAERVEERGPVVTKNDKENDVSSDSLSPLQMPVGLAVSDSEKVEAFVHSLETRFQLVNEPSEPATTDQPALRRSEQCS